MFNLEKYRRLILLALMLVMGCSSGGPSGPSFEDLITQGWQAFESKDFATAVSKFTDAKAKDPTKIEVYIGLGWSLFRQGNLNQADTEFAQGNTQAQATADLLAGWAFNLNAQKNFSLSNVRADQALALEPSWQFAHDPAISASDLHLLKAENYFLTGDFSKSLEEVKILNPAFEADLLTNAGLTALANEIERLKSQA